MNVLFIRNQIREIFAPGALNERGQQQYLEELIINLRNSAYEEALRTMKSKYADKKIIIEPRDLDTELKILKDKKY